MTHWTLGTQAPHNRASKKWLNSSVSFYHGTVAEVVDNIPTFERRCFHVTQPGSIHTGLNAHLDVIVRHPTATDPLFVPVGVVSKEYTLVQHKTVAEKAIGALTRAGISLTQVQAELALTRYGERMALHLYLPPEYSFDPGDGHAMALRFECFNSVDGSTRFRGLLGWFRFVCSNGLVVGISRGDIRRRHIGGLHLEELETVLVHGLLEAKHDKELFWRWRHTGFNQTDLSDWVNTVVKNFWGFKNATRVFHIALTGFDVEITEKYRNREPTTIRVRSTHPVPGMPQRARNLFDIAQIMAWLATTRHALEDQLKMRDEIPLLLSRLTEFRTFGDSLFSDD